MSDEIEPRVQTALPAAARVLRDKAWVNRFCGLVAAGTPITAACRLLDLKPSTVDHWIRKGRESGGALDYANFAAEVDKARAYFESRMLTNMARAADNGDWRAADRLLQISHPEDYSPQRGLVVGGDPNAPLKIELSFPSGIARDDYIDTEGTEHDPAPELEA